MQGNDNLIRTYKQKNKDNVRKDKKRDKHSEKALYQKQRKLREKEIEE